MRNVVYNKKICRLILVNSITLARLPMIVIFLYELTNFLETGKPAYGFYSMIISILILFSDFIDGTLARKYDVATKFGQNMDIYLDLAYVLSSSAVLAEYDKVDYFYVMVIIYKFLEFIVLSKLFKGRSSSKKGSDYYYDLPGTIAGGLYYLIPLIVICLMYFKAAYMDMIVEAIVISAVIMTFMASVIKMRAISCRIKGEIWNDKIS